MRPKKRARYSDVVEHELCTRPNFTGIWKTKTNSWSKVKTQYAKINCATCNTKIRTYCKCNKKVSMCTECYGKHISAVNNTFQGSTKQHYQKKQFIVSQRLYCPFWQLVFYRSFYMLRVQIRSMQCYQCPGKVLNSFFSLKGIKL